MNSKQPLILKLNKLLLIAVLILEIGFGLIFVYFFYPLFSMLAFGEGDQSFMYTTTNGILMFLIPYIFTISLNVYKIKVTADKTKSSIFIWATIVLTIWYPLLGIWMWN